MDLELASWFFCVKMKLELRYMFWNKKWLETQEGGGG